MKDTHTFNFLQVQGGNTLIYFMNIGERSGIMKIRRSKAMNIVKENTALKEENNALKEELVYEKEQRDLYFKKGKDSFVNGDDTVRGES